MLPLTKAADEGLYIKALRWLLSACFLMVPLLFFTDLTANPFAVQSVLLYILIALMYSVSAVRFLRAGKLNFTHTFFDLAFLMYILATVVGWLSAISVRTGLCRPARQELPVLSGVDRRFLVVHCHDNR